MEAAASYGSEPLPRGKSQQRLWPPSQGCPKNPPVEEQRWIAKAPKITSEALLGRRGLLGHALPENAAVFNPWKSLNPFFSS